MSAIVKYFNGEKQESYIFIIMGVFAFAIALCFIFIVKTAFWKGVAIPFILVALLEFVVGYTIVTRSPKDITRVERFINNEPKKIRTDEIPRMQKVLRNFVIFRYIDIPLSFHHD